MSVQALKGWAFAVGGFPLLEGSEPVCCLPRRGGRLTLPWEAFQSLRVPIQARERIGTLRMRVPIRSKRQVPVFSGLKKTDSLDFPDRASGFLRRIAVFAQFAFRICDFVENLEFPLFAFDICDFGAQNARFSGFP